MSQTTDLHSESGCAVNAAPPFSCLLTWSGHFWICPGFVAELILNSLQSNFFWIQQKIIAILCNFFIEFFCWCSQLLSGAISLTFPLALRLTCFTHFEQFLSPQLLFFSYFVWDACEREKIEMLFFKKLKFLFPNRKHQLNITIKKQFCCVYTRLWVTRLRYS